MFRKRKPAKQLSAEELKSKLYAHFDKSGSLNQMRTEIRSKLVTELFKMSSPAPNVNQLTNDFDKTLLPLQVCNWLVYDHLLRQGYQYALSTFVTEANVPQPERLLTACDILSLFRLDSGTPEYKSISKMYSANNEEGLLHSLLLAVIKSLFDFPNQESINQSTNVKDSGVSIKETTADVSLFEKIDSSEIPKFNREIFTGTRKKSADSSFPEQLQLLKEEKEREILALRQKWLEELDRLHFKERAMKEDIESKRKEIQRELNEILSEKKKLKEKEFLLVKEHENELAKRIRELESDHMAKIHSKENELKLSQGKLYDKELRGAQVEADLTALQTDYHSLKRELEEIQQTYKLTKEKYSVLLDENTKLLKKFESMSDYSIIKGDLEARSKEISGLLQQLYETKDTAEKEKTSLLDKIRSLETKLKYKESQLLEAQRQLSLCRDTMHREESIWHKERKKLEQDSQESKEMYKTLIHRLEEQREDIQALHHTIHILHFQLTDTDKRNQAKPDTFVPQRTINKFQDMNIKEPGVFRLSNNNSKYSDDSLKFIEEAKSRIKNLEKEAYTLRDKCSSVFCHVPGIKDAHTHNSGTNPLAFNFANVPVLPTSTFQSQSYNNRFETLIQNEMPILDSCLQTHAKRQYTNIATGLNFPKSSNLKTDIPKNTGLERNEMTPFSDLSSLNLYNQDFVPAYSPNNEVSASNRLKVKSISLGKEHSESQILQQPTDSISNYPSTKKEQNSKTTGKLTNIQSKPSIPSTGNVSSKPKEADTTIVNYDSTTKLPSLNSFTQVGQTQSEISPTIQPHSHDYNVNEDKINSLKEVSAVEDSSVKEDSALEPDTPVVVDLDSAWKRKTSLKDNFESQSVPHILSGLESAWKRKTSLVMASRHSLLNSSLSTLSDDEKRDIAKATGLEREQILDQNKDSGVKYSDAEIIQTASQSKNNEHAKDLTLELKSQVPSVYGTELGNNEKKLSSENFEDTKEKSDTVVERQTLQESKEILEDSISEQSDLHFSCGSEQEQQKEDSDNW